MLIKFVCPNGHPLAAPQQRAGKTGKCPKCGTGFLIPTLEEIEADQSDDSEPEDSEPEGSDTYDRGVNQRQPQGAAAAAADLVVFLCPNGHKLNGPSSLKGRPGQCPHCGVRFRIPSDEDLEEEEEDELSEQAMPTGTFVDDQDAEQSLEDMEEFSEPVELIDEDDEDEEDDEEARVVAAMSAALAASSGESGHPLGGIIGHLWNQKEPDNVIQLHLRDGQVLTVHYFAPALSQHNYGVFAIRHPDRTFTVTTIAWDAVTQVGMGNVRRLPEDLFYA